MPPKLINNNEYLKLIRELNDKQKKFLLNILHLVKTTNEPFYHFLSGAGVGKSHVITSIVQTYLRCHMNLNTTDPKKTCVVISAPTGKAAFNVFGARLHSNFHLPANQYNGPLIDLIEIDLNTLQVQFCETKLFIIDEISMVSVRQLFQIDQRLRQIFVSPLPFGGKSIITVGHLRQILPIAAKHIFKTPSHLPNGDLVGNYLWELFRLFQLTEIMRQKGDKPFCKALNNMSEGNVLISIFFSYL